MASSKPSESKEQVPAAKRSRDNAGGSTNRERKPVRVWCDGCFDVCHWGHANALRQAKQEGDWLVVGVHSDADIIKNKGPPVMNEQERYAAVRAIKWVDEVVEGAPYVTHLSTLDAHDIDFCVHGEDITTDADGNDTYQAVKDAGRYRTIKRAEGVSTTEIVGRMLLMTRDHQKGGVDKQQVNAMAKASPYTSVTQFYPTTRRIVQFSEGFSAAKRGRDTVVYIDGGFDLFHVGHVAALKAARALGTYLVVGVHEDGVLNAIKGANLPILNLHERVLSVLACKYVDEVVIGAPWAVDEAMIESLNIAVVAHGSVSDYPEKGASDGRAPPDAYAVPKRLGIYKQFRSSQATITTSTLIKRILDNRAKFLERNRKKEASEIAYIEEHKLEGQ